MSYVYFVGTDDGKHIKIGFSKDVKWRFINLKYTAPEEFRPNYGIGYIKGSRELEKDLHRRFSSCRVRGEWFRLDESLSTFLSSLKLRQIKDQKKANDWMERLSDSDVPRSFTTRIPAWMIRSIKLAARSSDVKIEAVFAEAVADWLAKDKREAA